MGRGFWVALAAIVVIMIGAVFVLNDQAEAPSRRVENPHEITAEDHTLGNESAPITVIEYADFQCPACRSSAPLIKEMLTEYEGEVQFVYRHFPLTQIHPQAYDAARAAVAAGKQNAFWEMHDLLFERQGTWSANPQARSLFEDYAAELELDLDQYRQDFTAASDRVDRDTAIGNQLNVNGTPTFFIDGELIEQTPTTIEAWRELIDARLADIEANESAEE